MKLVVRGWYGQVCHDGLGRIQNNWYKALVSYGYVRYNGLDLILIYNVYRYWSGLRTISQKTLKSEVARKLL